ncbi:hypothetical protein [Arthrobacter pigmenti]
MANAVRLKKSACWLRGQTRPVVEIADAPVMTGGHQARSRTTRTDDY